MPDQIDPSIPLAIRPLTPIDPDYQGQWIGQWVRGQCSDRGLLAGFCQHTDGGSLSLTLTQSASRIFGTLRLRAVLFHVSGHVSDDGALVLSGEGLTAAGETTAIASLWAWRTTIHRGGGLTGSFAFTLNVSPGFGLAAVNATLRSVQRQRARTH
jgi:hypothetical protein